MNWGRARFSDFCSQTELSTSFWINPIVFLPWFNYWLLWFNLWLIWFNFWVLWSNLWLINVIQSLTTVIQSLTNKCDSIFDYCDPSFNYCDPIFDYCDPIFDNCAPMFNCWAVPLRHLFCQALSWSGCLRTHNVNLMHSSRLSWTVSYLLMTQINLIIAPCRPAGS